MGSFVHRDSWLIYLHLPGIINDIPGLIKCHCQLEYAAICVQIMQSHSMHCTEHKSALSFIL